MKKLVFWPEKRLPSSEKWFCRGVESGRYVDQPAEGGGARWQRRGWEDEQGELQDDEDDEDGEDEDGKRFAVETMSMRG